MDAGTKKDRTCLLCKHELEYSPEGHEEYPYLCRSCGARWSETVPWWGDTLPEILRIAALVLLGIGGLVWMCLNPFHTWWAFLLGCLAIAYAASSIVTRLRGCF